jgi:hypothetical protein
MTWKPATVEDVKRITEQDLSQCDTEQAAAFRRFKVEPYTASIARYGKLEDVFVVAKKENAVLYWEDVEEGFAISKVAPDGLILEHNTNQDSLGIALNAWIEGRGC